MQLEGFLSRFPLRELLELSVASLVNGAIEIQAPSGMHRLFFREGALVHASSPEACGLDALWPLFELHDAPFCFVAGATTFERTIGEPTPQVIEQASALAQQWSTVRPLIPTLSIIPELASLVRGDQVQIFEEDWPILSAVDGMRTIADVAQYASRDPLEVCVGLLRLKERGLVSFSMHHASSQSAPADPVPSDPPSREKATTEQRPSFFAKLLTNVPEGACAPDILPAVAELPPALPPNPTEYDDILSLLRS